MSDTTTPPAPTSPGALHGIRIVEMAGLGPAPFCAMLLADHGADIVRVVRPGQKTVLPIEPRFDLSNRGRPSLELDLKTERDRAVLRRLIAQADALIEGFRPGVMEKMGFGPDAALDLNPRLVYGRMTGWGQHGPLAQTAGHDLNYAGLSGAIATLGDPAAPPPPPLNLVADFGGGAMFLAFGILAALLEARRSGQGQVVDAAMTDGVALLMTMMYGMHAGKAWSLRRFDNLLDGGAPFYGCYACADGKFVSVCALEPQFYRALCKRLELESHPDFARQDDRDAWPRMRAVLAGLFAARPRRFWEELFAGSDACVAPVLGIDEAPQAPHNRARATFSTIDGITQPNPAPRFSRTPAPALEPVAAIEQDSAGFLARWEA